MRTIEELRGIEICDFDLSTLSDSELTTIECFLHEDWEDGVLHSLNDFREIIRELAKREFNS